ADGHDFVAAAAANGATAALVTRAVADPIIQDNRCVQIIVENCQQALDDLAMMGRISHQQAGGRLVGITGSVGKTGSKEMLAHILVRMGGCHASQASFN
ncbi:MAG: UDP-N-acetylmuramoyl-tripeptide--D-alanyl-D-alanine ligase, partial [Alphaproteobacteria bacterium]